MSTSGTVSEVAGWPEAIALILWGVVALVLIWGIYEIYETIEGGLSSLQSGLASFFFGSGSGSGSGSSSGSGSGSDGGTSTSANSVGSFVANLFGNGG